MSAAEIGAPDHDEAPGRSRDGEAPPARRSASQRMKPLLVNTYDERGGAARAAMRLLAGLRGLGLDARLLVQRKFGRDPSVIEPGSPLVRTLALARPRLESLPVRFYSKRRRSLFSAAVWPSGTHRRIGALKPDLVHLHWIAFGFLRPEALRAIRVPIVWTMHDAWAFTGGCHLPEDCTRYRDSCGACPGLGSTREMDLSRQGFLRKKRAYAGRSITFVAPSRWLADAARSSALLGEARIEIIPNGIDLSRFAPGDPSAARAALGLPHDRRIVLYSALEGLSDRNKAFPLLAAALERLARSGWKERMLLVVMGASGPPEPLGISMDARFLGPLDDESQVALAMAAADVVALPSFQENQPLVVLEAMGCARPVVAFGATGIAEVVEHAGTGYLARPYDPEDLARGLVWVLEDDERRRGLGASARARAAREHDIALVAGRYLALYKERVAAASC